MTTPHDTLMGSKAIDGRVDGIPVAHLASQIIVMPGFIPDKVCDSFLKAMPSNRLMDHKVMGGLPGGRTEKKIRDTKSVDISRIMMSVNAVMARIADEVAGRVDASGLVYDAPPGPVSIEAWEHPQVLYYQTGGHYQAHVDATDHPAPGGGLMRGEVVRDVSVLAYLNGDFNGGEIDFPELGFRIKPTKGMAVAFPSNHRFLHAAMPVTAGERYALVCWMKARGTPGTERYAAMSTPRDKVQAMRW